MQNTNSIQSCKEKFVQNDYISLTINKDDISCIYFLMENDVIVYIGKTINFIERINGHVDKRFTHARIYNEENNSNLAILEVLSIDHFKPIYNKEFNFKTVNTLDLKLDIEKIFSLSKKVNIVKEDRYYNQYSRDKRQKQDSKIGE